MHMQISDATWPLASILFDPVATHGRESTSVCCHIQPCVPANLAFGSVANSTEQFYNVSISAGLAIPEGTHGIGVPIHWSAGHAQMVVRALQ